MSSTDFQNGIKATNEAFMGAVSRGDAAGMAAVYTTNGQVLPTNSDVIMGKAAIQGFWQGMLDALGSISVQLKTVELDHHGHSATEVGEYTILSEAGQTVDSGKFIVSWKQEDGQWKWHRDIFNTSQPPSE